ncbi:MAG: ABC transporter ATP-binding protein [Chloroflexi bacterium]|nr:ABC transporter ATP-binding protein [Chloroflexota bacterium]
MRFSTPTGAVQALEDVSLSVGSREFVSLLGPSGCGKSTLLRLVSDVLTPTDGAIRVGGRTPEEARKGRSFGFVFQDATLLAWRTALQNVLLPLEISGNTRGANERAARLLDLVGLQGFEHSFPWQLSGGMRQRVSIARALISEPHILLMDEPFGALDEITRERLNSELLRIWQATATTILFVTHSSPEAVFLSDRVVVLTARPGRVKLTLSIELPRPRDPAIKDTVEFARYTGALRRALTSEPVDPA